MSSAPLPPNFRVITTLRYEFRQSIDPSAKAPPSWSIQPVGFRPSSAERNALNDHIDRLQCSSIAADWHSPKHTFRRFADSAADLRSSISTQIWREYKTELFSGVPVSPQAFRVRLDLYGPGDGGALKVGVWKTDALPIYRTFDPFDHSRLPSPQELIGGEVDGSLPPVWQVKLHTKPTKRSFHTDVKTSERSVYDQARKAVGADLNTEVLLQNEDGEIMDGTISSVYFWREARWVTPAKECGPLESIARSWALKVGNAVEGHVKAKDIRHREIVWMGNALRGFGWGWLEVEEKGENSGS